MVTFLVRLLCSYFMYIVSKLHKNPEEYYLNFFIHEEIEGLRCGGIFPKVHCH